MGFVMLYPLVFTSSARKLTTRGIRRAIVIDPKTKSTYVDSRLGDADFRVELDAARIMASEYPPLVRLPFLPSTENRG
jgi:hypothetical protein